MRLLGYNKPLKWEFSGDGGIKVEIPEALQTPENRPCEHAWAFQFDVEYKYFDQTVDTDSESINR